MTKNILILTASADRQKAAARNLCDALETLSPEARVQIADVFAPTGGSLRKMAQKAFTGFMRLAGAARGGINGSVHKQSLSGTGCFRLGRLQRAVGDLLQEAQPDVVVSTYPAYATLVGDLYRDHLERPFRLVSLITDAARVGCGGWLEGPSDLYCVSNESLAANLRTHSIAPERIKVCGFPVSPSASRLSQVTPTIPDGDGPYRILYLTNSDKKKVFKTLRRLLDREENHLTIVVGRDPYLKAIALS